jgi:hypothetical protein
VPLRLPILVPLLLLLLLPIPVPLPLQFPILISILVAPEPMRLSTPPLTLINEHTNRRGFVRPVRRIVAGI